MRRVGETVEVSGAMTFAGARALLDRGADMVREGGRRFDLAAVTEVDSASLRVSPANFHLFRSFLKSDEELLRTIEHGIVFSPMHAWTSSLTEGQMI